MSPSTIRRALDELVTSGQIQKRTKRGPSGGLLLRLANCSQTVQNCVQTVHERDVSARGAGPEGALSSPLRQPESVQTVQDAYRPVRFDEATDSNGEFVYLNDDPNGQWRHEDGPIWIAPNGDHVSERNMTLELKVRLGIVR